MLLTGYRGYEIHIPTSGGKAGKGNQVTSSLQVRKDNVIRKQFRFIISDPKSRELACQSAKIWINHEVLRREIGADENSADFAAQIYEHGGERS